MTVPEVFLSPEGMSVHQDASAKRGRFVAEVIANTALNPHHYRLKLRLSGSAAKAFADTIPGQFAQFDAANLALPPIERIPPELRESSGRNLLLRRPLSFAGITSEAAGDVVLEVLYCVLGPATLRMTTLAQGDTISVIGPLGKGYSLPAGKKLALLVSGGMGAPPLQHMAQWLRQHHGEVEPVAFVGARSVSELPYSVEGSKVSGEPSLCVSEFARYHVKSMVATDDGSLGYKGFVTQMLARWLDHARLSSGDAIIYACGPEAMMAATARLASERGIECQVSMERMMACGIGLCQSCAVECRGNGDTEYRLCCKDGPVFDARDVVWEEGR